MIWTNITRTINTSEDKIVIEGSGEISGNRPVGLRFIRQAHRFSFSVDEARDIGRCLIAFAKECQEAIDRERF